MCCVYIGNSDSYVMVRRLTLVECDDMEVASSSGMIVQRQLVVEM